MKAGLFTIIVILLGLQCAHSTTTYSYGFTYNGTMNSLNLGGYSAIYPLGTLSANYSIYATFSYPGISAASTQLTQDIMTLSMDPNHGLQYMDTSTGAPVLTRAYGTSQTNTIVYPTPTNPGLYRMTHNIMFPPTSNQTSAQFYLVLTNPMPIMSSKLLWYTLQLDYYPTSSGSSVASLAFATTILKVASINRGTLLKVIFIEKPNQFYNFTFFPGCQNPQACTPGFTFNIRSIATTVNYTTNGFNGNELVLGSAVPVAAT